MLFRSQQVLDQMPVRTGESSFGYLNDPDAIVAPVMAIRDHLEDIKKEKDIFVLQALFRSYAFLSSAYLLEPSFQQFRKNQQYGKARQILPAHIARPFCEVAQRLDVYPWLDYHYGYSLGNYRKLDPSGDLDWENITMCNRFSGQRSEEHTSELQSH